MLCRASERSGCELWPGCDALRQRAHTAPGRATPARPLPACNYLAGALRTHDSSQEGGREGSQSLKTHNPA